MSLTIQTTSLPGVLKIQGESFRDDRGFFAERFHSRKYADLGIDHEFLQDNFSRSAKGVLRGLHYQYPNPQGKLISVTRGAIWDVAVDIRRGSPDFGRWVGVELSDQNDVQLFIAPGFAHGFCVLSEEEADVYYKCTELYDAEADHGILWCDPALAIEWPVAAPVVSPKDAKLPALGDIADGLLPEYAEKNAHS